MLGRVQPLVAELSGTRIGTTFNQYADGPRAALLRERLDAYLAARTGATLLLVGEAPGYRGARVSGVPFTSERQVTGRGPAEATSTIVQRVLRDLGIEDDVLLWNVVPTHPGTAVSNRAPTRDEVEAGRRFAERWRQIARSSPSAGSRRRRSAPRTFVIRPAAGPQRVRLVV